MITKLTKAEKTAHIEAMTKYLNALSYQHFGFLSVFTVEQVTALYDGFKWTCVRTGIQHSEQTPLIPKLILSPSRLERFRLSNLRIEHDPAATMYKRFLRGGNNG